MQELRIREEIFDTSNAAWPADMTSKNISTNESIRFSFPSFCPFFFLSHQFQCLLAVLVLGIVGGNGSADSHISIGQSAINRRYPPSTGVSLVGPRRHPTLDSRCAVRREVLVEHHTVPVTAAVNNGGYIWSGNRTYASLVSGISLPHSGLGLFIISSVTWSSAWSLRPSIQL